MATPSTTHTHAPGELPEPKAPRPGFPASFWMLNTIEMWERLAYYNLRVMAPIYIMQASDPGGLHLTAGQKGTIYAWWAAFQSLLPILTGGIADRYGYKKTMAFSIVTIMIGYLLIAFMRDLPWISNYHAVFLAIMVQATGTAFFKPSIQGSLAQNLTKENSSMGWGIFYWVVNVGAFVGHYLPGLFLGTEHTPESWRNLFLSSAGFTALNLGMLFTFKDVPSGADKSESILKVAVKTFTNIFEPRLVAWLLIMAGFWLMMYQLWDLQPNFIADWVDSTPVASALLGDAAQTTENLKGDWRGALLEKTDRGWQVPQQVLLSVNSMCIIIGVVGMAWLTRKMRTLSAMLGGMMFAIAGLLVAGFTMNVWWLVAGIVLFSLGEMTTGPKKSEYLALIAPPGKKGLYLGYVNIPVGLGVFVGSKLAGFLYGNYGEKAVLALRYIAERTPYGKERGWDGEVSGLEVAMGIKRPDAFAKLQELTGLDAHAATRMLWDTYDPQYYVWIPFAAIGVVAAVALWAFGRMARKWKDMDA
jgi:dipeptide/tripeptide permease